MRFVAYFTIGLGVLIAIGGLFTVLRGGISNIITGVVQIIIGVWTNKAASSFKLIANTQGNDIENLMGALGELRKLYTLQYWLLIITLIFAALGLVLLIIGVGSGTIR
jgi:ABC-type bacteriocin/lantibiotic exporter with double-glycine peptidase domain